MGSPTGIDDLLPEEPEQRKPRRMKCWLNAAEQDVLDELMREHDEKNRDHMFQAVVSDCLRWHGARQFANASEPDDFEGEPGMAEQEDPLDNCPKCGKAGVERHEDVSRCPDGDVTGTGYSKCLFCGHAFDQF